MTDDEYDKRVAQLQDWYGEEDLDPELEDYLEEADGEGREWTSIRHPLVYSIMHAPMMNKRVNMMLRQKREALHQATEEGNWHTYVYLHERPYRVSAFATIEHELSDSEYWELLASIWVDSENIRQNPEVWTRLLQADRENTTAMMSVEDWEALQAMPDVIPVYQGHTDVRDDGWSWTTARGTAEWFANRFANLEGAEPLVSCASVNRADVFAYLTNRGEYEIIVNPAKVRVHQTYTPGKAKTMATHPGKVTVK